MGPGPFHSQIPAFLLAPRLMLAANSGLGLVWYHCQGQGHWTGETLLHGAGLGSHEGLRPGKDPSPQAAAPGPGQQGEACRITHHPENPWEGPSSVCREGQSLLSWLAFSASAHNWHCLLDLIWIRLISRKSPGKHFSHGINQRWQLVAADRIMTRDVFVWPAWCFSNFLNYI